MRVAFDVETLPLEHSHPRPIFACVAVAVDGAPARVVTQPEALRLLDAANVVVAHRAPFDVEALGWKPSAQRIRDTSIRGVLIGAANGQHAAASSGLRELARPLGITLGGKGSTQLSFRPGAPLTPEQERYVCADVDATDAVFMAQGGDVDVSPAEGWQTARAFDVWRMRERGIRLDVPRVQALLREGNERRDALRRPLVDAGIIQPRGPKKDPWRDSSVDQSVVQARLRAAGVTARPKRRATDERPESGLLSAEGDVLRAAEDPALVALADYKDAEKWVSLVEAFDVGPVARPFWQPCVASGRISASRPNVTQIPRAGGLRECVISGEGNVFVMADYTALEFYCWADVCFRWLGWSTARDALIEGKDPHTLLAAVLGGDRQAAKLGNFGFAGGMGAARAAKQWGLPESRALAIQNAWKRMWPEWRAYFRKIKAGREGELYRVRLPWSGRERLSFYSEAANVILQGTGSDVAKQALANATRAGLPIVALIHDELIAEVPQAQARDAAETLREGMEAAGREVCPNVPWRVKTEIKESWTSK